MRAKPSPRAIPSVEPIAPKVEQRRAIVDRDSKHGSMLGKLEDLGLDLDTTAK